MRVLGVDFTSSPSVRKPITVCAARLDGDRLTFEHVRDLSGFAAFESLLREGVDGGRGAWIAGMDFPFGQPLEFVRGSGWPEDWEGMVGRVASLGRAGYVGHVTAYSQARPDGLKRPRRLTDTRARAASPVNVVNPPVGKMFAEGGPRLLAAGVRVVACSGPRGEADRTVCEAYPALVASALLGGRGAYKSGPGDSPGERGVREARRATLVWALLGGRRVLPGYGVRVGRAGREATLSDDALVGDAGGDRLDACLACVQAAWAWGQRERAFGVPPEAHPAEGWIVDPALHEPSAGDVWTLRPTS